MSKLQEKLKEFNYPRHSCLCGSMPSLHAICEGLKGWYNATQVLVRWDEIVVYTHYLPESFYISEEPEPGLHRVYIPNPYRSGICFEDVSCCGLPACVSQLEELLSNALGIEIYLVGNHVFEVGSDELLGQLPIINGELI